MVDIVRYAGFANDPTPEGAAPAATFHVDLASASLDAPSDSELVVPSGISRAARRHKPGFYSPSGDIVYAADIQTIANFFRWALGGYEYTVNAGDDLHEMWGTTSTTLPYFIARVGKDVFEHVFRGCIANTLSLAVENEFAQLTVGVSAIKDAKAALQAVSALLLPAEYPLAFHEVTVTKDAGDFTAKVKSLTLNIENGAAADEGRSLGSRYARRIPSRERVTTLDMSLYFEDTSQLEEFWGGATGPADAGSGEFALEIHLDGGADGEADIYLPVCTYTTVPTQVSGRDETTQDVSVRAWSTQQTLNDAVTDVESEILVAVLNDQTDLAA